MSHHGVPKTVWVKAEFLFSNFHMLDVNLIKKLFPQVQKGFFSVHVYLWYFKSTFNKTCLNSFYHSNVMFRYTHDVHFWKSFVGSSCVYASHVGSKNNMGSNGSKGAPGSLGPIFVSFSCTFQKKMVKYCNRLCTPLHPPTFGGGVGVSLSGKSWIRHWIPHIEKNIPTNTVFYTKLKTCRFRSGLRIATLH